MENFAENSPIEAEALLLRRVLVIHGHYSFSAARCEARWCPSFVLEVLQREDTISMRMANPSLSVHGVAHVFHQGILRLTRRLSDGNLSY